MSRAPDGRRLRLPTTLICGFAMAAIAAAGAAAAGALAEADGPPGEMHVRVTLDAAGQGGAVTAAVRIHARREDVWPLITSCAEELKIVPGLIGCEVEQTAADGTVQVIRHVLLYSWYAPRLSYEFRATYAKPVRVSIERVSGDLDRLAGSWTLESDGEYTVAHYAVDLAPGFWVPHWMVRAALRRDLPKMLRALQARAEAVAAGRAKTPPGPR